jgi:hypothetical protein
MERSAVIKYIHASLFYFKSRIKREYEYDMCYKTYYIPIVQQVIHFLTLNYYTTLWNFHINCYLTQSVSSNIFSM